MKDLNFLDKTCQHLDYPQKCELFDKYYAVEAGF